MPDHVSILRVVACVVLALTAVLWIVGLTRLVRRPGPVLPPRRHGTAPEGAPANLLPRQRTGPREESVDLSPAERDAFYHLVRRLARQDRLRRFSR
ncbi:hypothetical protein [Streptomyces minutiscleroticus]|uniref:Uncharacterized protein n=1 Tax=Streptomyces minutiscleroticus TaxID=68238 RepID=A0A918NNI2_9ACTN|nr:hypothetical protein [Streptomyces minutiscleroticus]GGX83166.1 hypothetical protein GCM10010358_41790 [Streptomyces minutiscleroticus]